MKYITYILFMYKITTDICGLGINDSDEYMTGKIINGQAVTIDVHPYAVMFYNHASLCSGSIITSWSVLTAAHCFDVNDDVTNMRIVAGSTFGKVLYKFNFYYVKKYIVHEKYNEPMRFASDIALLFVTKQFQFNKKIQKAFIVNNIDWMKSHEKAIVIGWGWTQPTGVMSNTGLMQTVLDFVPKAECEKKHKMKLGEDMFCLYGDGQRDSCKGDSGGGVTWNGFLIGIVSHGRGCAIVDKPSVYTNVWLYRRWIEDSIDNYYSLVCKKRNKSVINYNHQNKRFYNY